MTFSLLRAEALQRELQLRSFQEFLYPQFRVHKKKRSPKDRARYQYHVKLAGSEGVLRTEQRNTSRR
jgi:hypothetical protein